MKVRLDDIAMFVEVARRKSISQTAEHLGIPTSTLSRRISKLENDLGFKLLNRSTRRIELTEMGAGYYTRCMPLIDEARTAHEQLQDLVMQPRGVLRVSMPTTLATQIMPELLEPFTRAYPDIVCDIHLGSEPIDDINNPFDVALRLGRQPDSSLVSRQYASMEQWLYASAEYLARSGVPASPEDLEHHDCLRPFFNGEKTIWSLCRGDETRHVPVSGHISSNNVAMLTRLAAKGLGILPVPMCHATALEIRRNDLRRVLPEWHLGALPLYVLLRSRSAPAKVQVFLDYLRPLVAWQPVTDEREVR